MVALVLGILLVPRSSDAQSTGRLARISLLLTDVFPFDVQPQQMPSPLRQALHDLGWVEGQNLVFETRSAEGDLARLPALAAELVRLAPDLILAVGSNAIRAAQHATCTIPIIMLGTADPVGAGFAVSLARPGANITGLSTMQADLNVKKLQLLKEAVPRISRVAVLADSAAISTRALMGEKDLVARTLGVQLDILEVADPSALEPAFAAIANTPTDALMVLPSTRFGAHHRQIVDLVARSQLPAVYSARWFVEAGGLMCYGGNLAEAFRRAAIYVDKILKGANPADLPIEQPTTHEFVINLKTAQPLGLTIPPSLLFQATEVIRRAATPSATRREAFCKINGSNPYRRFADTALGKILDLL